MLCWAGGPAWLIPAAPSGEEQVLGPGFAVDVGRSQCPGECAELCLRTWALLILCLVHPTRGTSELGSHIRPGSWGLGSKEPSPGLCTQIFTQSPRL